MTISGIIKNSFVDYPGLISCVIFVPGCNYDCFYCHNRTLIDGTHDLIGSTVLWDFLSRRKGMIDAVVISGGEPTLQPGLPDFLQAVKDLGFRTKLDTNGSSPQMVSSLLEEGLCDYVAVDYKVPSSRYEEICGAGADAASVLDTIRLLLYNKANFEVRTTLIPQLDEDDLLCMVREVPAVPRYVLNRYRKPERYKPGDESKITACPRLQCDLFALKSKMKLYQPNLVI
jgi:pyruvate formate lyase activating enzyme